MSAASCARSRRRASCGSRRASATGGSASPTSPAPAGGARRARRARRRARGSVLAPLSAHQRERLVGAMREIERLLTAASVEIVSADPEHPDARRCFGEYVAELNRRSERGFDPLAGETALPHEVRPPAGSSSSPTSTARRSAAARSSTTPARRARSSACGSIRRRAGWGSAGGCWSVSRRPRSRRRTRRAHRDEHGPARGDRALPVGRLGRGARVQRGAVRRPLAREGARSLGPLRRGPSPRLPTAPGRAGASCGTR